MATLHAMSGQIKVQALQCCPCFEKPQSRCRHPCICLLIWYLCSQQRTHFSARHVCMHGHFRLEGGNNLVFSQTDQHEVLKRGWDFSQVCGLLLMTLRLLEQHVRNEQINFLWSLLRRCCTTREHHSFIFSSISGDLRELWAVVCVF